MVLQKLVFQKKTDLMEIGDAISSCISEEKNLTKISDTISKIIQTDGIKYNPDLIFNIINGFIKGYLMQKPDNIKDIAKSF